MQGQDGRCTATASSKPPMEIGALPSTLIRGARTQLAVDFLASTDPACDSPATGGVTGGAGMEDEVEAEVEEDATTGQREAADDNHAKEYLSDSLIAQPKVRGNAEARNVGATWTEQRKQQLIEDLNPSQARSTGAHVHVGVLGAAKGGSGSGAVTGAGAGTGVDDANEVERGIFEFLDHGSHGVVSSANGNASREGANFNDQHVTVGCGRGSGRGEGVREHAGGGSDGSGIGQGNENEDKNDDLGHAKEEGDEA